MAAQPRLNLYEWGRRGDPAVLYWDGLGGTGLHANEIGPILAEEFGLWVIAPDPPGHGRSPAGDAESFRPTRLAETALGLLSDLGIPRAAFLGFSWGGRVGVWFAARHPERTTALALVEGGHYGSPAPTTLAQATAEARAEREEETFESWDAFVASERESLRRWTPELEEAHRAIMREEDGRVVPIASAEVVGAIHHASRLEPVAEAYPGLAAAGVPVLLIVAGRLADESVARFRAALPQACVETIPNAIHDLVSFAPGEIAARVGTFLSRASNNLLLEP